MINPFEKIKADLAARKEQKEIAKTIAPAYNALKQIAEEAKRGPVVKLVNTGDLKSPALELVGSSPTRATIDTPPLEREISRSEWKGIQAIKRLAHTLRVKLYGLWTPLMACHPLDNMTPERYKELMEKDDLELTKEELAQGYAFCCEWDGLLIHASHPEAGCCSCLMAFRQKHGITDEDLKPK